MGQLDGRIALVCGASKGIGAAIAERLMSEGAQVHGLARSAELLDSMQLDGCIVQDLDDLDARIGNTKPLHLASATANPR